MSAQGLRLLATALCQLEGSRGTATVEWRDMAHLTLEQQDHQEGGPSETHISQRRLQPSEGETLGGLHLSPLPVQGFCHSPGYCEVHGKEMPTRPQTPALAEHSCTQVEAGPGLGGGRRRQEMVPVHFPSL